MVVVCMLVLEAGKWVVGVDMLGVEVGKWVVWEYKGGL